MRTHCSRRDVASAEQKKLDPEIMLTIRWWSLIIPRTFWLAMEQICFKEEICRAMMGCCSKLKGLFYIVILLSSELYGTQNAAGFLPRYVMSEIVIRYLPKCVPFPLNVRVLAHMSHNFIGFFFYLLKDRTIWLLNMNRNFSFQTETIYASLICN